jgi:hypothetical protein
MADGRQRPEIGKGLGFEASARSERFRDPFAHEALHVSRRIESFCWRVRQRVGAISSTSPGSKRPACSARRRCPKNSAACSARWIGRGISVFPPVRQQPSSLPPASPWAKRMAADVQQGAVVYVTSEGVKGVKRRLIAMRRTTALMAPARPGADRASPILPSPASARR